MPLAATLEDLESWVGHKGEKRIPMYSTVVIGGTWKPGMVDHHVLNDGDYDIWTAVGQNPTNSYLENLIVQIKKDWFCNQADTFQPGVNMKVELFYHVQFKGLNDPGLWPNSSGAAEYQIDRSVDERGVDPAII